MKAVRIEEHGGLDKLKIVELPDPEPGPGEVRVRIRAVALSYLDVWVRKGVPGHPFPLPLIPGSDGVGTVGKEKEGGHRNEDERGGGSAEGGLSEKTRNLGEKGLGFLLSRRLDGRLDLSVLVPNAIAEAVRKRRHISGLIGMEAVGQQCLQLFMIRFMGIGFHRPVSLQPQ